MQGKTLQQDLTTNWHLVIQDDRSQKIFLQISCHRSNYFPELYILPEGRNPSELVNCDRPLGNTRCHSRESRETDTIDPQSSAN